MSTSQLIAPDGDDFWAIFSHDGKRLFSGGQNNKIWIWDIVSLQLAGSIETDEDLLLDADLHPNADLLVTTGRSPSGRIWKLGDGKELEREETQAMRASHVRFDNVS